MLVNNYLFVGIAEIVASVIKHFFNNFSFVLVIQLCLDELLVNCPIKYFISYTFGFDKYILIC